MRAYLSFLSPQEHWRKLRFGMAFLIREDQRVVAYGSITRVLDLEASARRAQDAGE